MNASWGSTGRFGDAALEDFLVPLNVLGKQMSLGLGIMWENGSNPDKALKDELRKGLGGRAPADEGQVKRSKVAFSPDTC